MLTMIGAIAEFERQNLLDRQAEGIALAKKRGVYKGRKKIQIQDLDPDLKKRFDEKCSINISMGSEEFDKRVKNRIQTAVSLAHIDTEKLVIQWNEELIKSKDFVLTPSDIIVQLPSKFLKDMDREYELYTFKDRENKYANELASLIVRYCRAPSGRKYNLQSVKDALANDFKRRQAKREEKAFEKYAQRISDSENKTSSDDISSSEDRSSRLK